MGPAGVTGPCGPDTEIFYDTGKPKCGPNCDPSCSCGKYLEIWNNVFMEYNKKADGTFAPLSQKNVDTGMGLDRTIATLQGVESVYDTDAFTGIIAAIAKSSGKTYGQDEETTRAFRIVADHIRCAYLYAGRLPRGVTPSNVDQGYILRRLIRRAIRYAMQLGDAGQQPDPGRRKRSSPNMGSPILSWWENHEKIMSELSKEEQRFQRTLKNGMKEFDRVKDKAENGMIDGLTAFHLYDTFGFPVEFTQEMAKENGLQVDLEGFKKAFDQHQEKSKAGAEQRFKGGLADTSEQTARLHSATHLLQAALRRVLQDDTISQRGSNITAERLRFDFSFGRKVTPEELKAVEDEVNRYIQAAVPITCQEMTVEEAKAQGAIGLFGDKYGERVKVYTMGDFSKEICGGPHAENTGDLHHFKIKKEEASSAGVRRIKAILD